LILLEEKLARLKQVKAELARKKAKNAGKVRQNAIETELQSA
jgi:hypothetical protein